MHANRTMGAAFTLLAAACATSPPGAWKPPPDAAQASPRYVVYDTRPREVDSEQCDSVKDRESAPVLRSADMEGEAHIWLHVDERGIVSDVRMAKSSGYAQLDRIALQVARCKRFRPALSDGVPVAVWIQLPFTFRAR